MKKGIFVITAMMMAWLAEAQVTLKTIVTQGPVVAGESFQVQYVLEDRDGRDAEFFQPDFKPFGFVSGPHMYGGTGYNDDGPVKLKNITFTLVAIQEGKYLIPGASVKSQGQFIRSQPATIEVISRATAIQRGILAEKAFGSDETYLQPGEDPVEKMRKNIFMKVSVDKRSCYVGQPVTATFKLYSRLNSKSDIIKNPGFYGFAMQEMIGLADNVTNTEMVNGKKFQVHTIRKVQLYPSQPGTYTIDPMEVQNKVEFSTSAVYKKTEQEIVEGVIPTEDELFSKPGFKFCENSMRTEAVDVKVKALPDTNRPAAFNGATGRFSITASLEREELASNEEGDLLVTVQGRGNFIQLAAPSITWPAGIEAFTPEVKDSLSRELSPLEGKRVFRFRFVSTKKGEYIIPGVSLSFFDPDSNRYRTVTTKPVTVNVTSAVARTIRPERVNGAERKKIPVVWWLGIASAIAVITAFMLIRKKRIGKKEPVVAEEKPLPAEPGVNELLKPAMILLQADEHAFYSALRKAIWDFSMQRFGLSGSSMNKRSLQQQLQNRGVASADQQSLLKILDTCEEGLFTGAASATDRAQLLDEARAVMLRISGN